ncbi:serine/threonine protein phosphatase 1 [Azorhizobium sp. AG788]|uniref:metallophosphoesterase n=1 Tax=Azorhizobium sp. AG788 TaxID=2183897 RepID=UPI0010E91BD6|nr:metallophosphoesterase [Azorhizobium sp. AG788]TDT87328.1 serine/threonine protein phosphatase 1 [Azorhizobium sp. AG788]
MDAFITHVLTDIHGRRDLLQSLVEAAVRQADSDGRTPRFVLLGDLVDRGPHSRAVLDLVCWLLRTFPASRLVLGNHDAWFIEAVEKGEHGYAEFPRWYRNGGYQTLMSYARGGDDLEDAIQRIRAEHADHLELLRNAELFLDEEPFVLVHAGIRPGVRLAAQSAEDFTTIGVEFLEHEGPLPRPVVHGHTVQKGLRPFVTENRIALDTGAYRSGVLTMMTIDALEGTLAFRATDPADRSVGEVQPIVEPRGGHPAVTALLPSLFAGRAALPVL